MELHGDDWKPEWDDAGRRHGRLYGRLFWAIAFCAALAGASLLMITRAGAQDCFSIEWAVDQLWQVVAKEKIGARAWVLPYPPAPQIELFLVWYDHRPELVVVSTFRRGCLVLNRQGREASVTPLTPEILMDLGNARLVFKNTEANPIQTY